MAQINQFDREQLLIKYLTQFQRQLLEKQLKIEATPEYRQRIEIMLLADEGKTQTQICRMLSCSPLTARHWIFVAKSGQAHTWQTQPLGRPKTVTSDYLNRLKQLVLTNPKDLGYPFSRWTGQWLSKHLCQEFDIGLSARHINRLIEDIHVEGKFANLGEGQQHQPIGSRNLKISDLSDRQIQPE
jgi:transposase